MPLSNGTPRDPSPSECWAWRNLKETASGLSSCYSQPQLPSGILSTSPGYIYMSLRKRDSPGSMNGDRIITQATIITTNSLWELLFIRLSRWEKVPGSHGQKALATGDQGMVSGLQQRKARRHHQGSEALITQANCCPHVPKFHPSILVSLPYIGFYLTSFENIKITDGRNKRLEKHEGAQTYRRDPSRAGKSLALSPAFLLWVLRQIVVPLRISSLSLQMRSQLSL